MVSFPSTQIYLDRPNRSQKVMLKVVRVLLHNGDQTMEAHAVLDDGSERTIVLPQVVRQLRLNRAPEVLPLQTIHQSHTKLDGSTVTLEVSSLTKPTERYVIRNAFTASGLSLAEHTYPVVALQKVYRHLKSLPLQPVDDVKPLLLIGSDMPHLLTFSQCAEEQSAALLPYVPSLVGYCKVQCVRFNPQKAHINVCIL